MNVILSPQIQWESQLRVQLLLVEFYKDKKMILPNKNQTGKVFLHILS
jgi:hypothetical protein